MQLAFSLKKLMCALMLGFKREKTEPGEPSKLYMYNIRKHGNKGHVLLALIQTNTEVAIQRESA